MGNLLGTVYTVKRVGKTKVVTVGDYQTRTEAEAAMIKHYAETPKRGQFFYSIGQEQLEEICGFVMRKITFSLTGQGGSAYQKYLPAELELRTNKN